MPWDVLRAVAALALGLWLSFGTSPIFGPNDSLAQAGPGVREGTSGPFRIQAVVVPSDPMVGKVQFRVRPENVATGEPVSDAAVAIFIGRHGRDELRTPGLNSPADRSTYVGNLEIEQAGDWSVRIDVRSAAGEGDLKFTIPVRRRARSGEGLVAPTLVFAGAAVVISLGVAWLAWQSRKARSRSPLPPGEG